MFQSFFFFLNYKKLIPHLLLFLSGFFLYYMRLFSVSGIVQGLGPHHYPLVLCLQGVISYFSVRFFSKMISSLGDNSVWPIIFIIIAFSYPQFFSDIVTSPVLNYFLVSASLIASLFIQAYFINFFISDPSLSDNQNGASRLMLSEELGGLVSSFIAFHFGFGLYSLPIGIIFILVLIWIKPKIQSQKDIRSEQLELMYPFGDKLVQLFVVIMVCKVSFGFLQYYSFNQAREMGEDFFKIFSTFSSFEASITILFLILKGDDKFNIEWPNGIKLFFLLSISFMVISMFSVSFYFFLAGCSVLKIWQKVVLKESQHSILKSLPLKVRMHYWSESEKSSYIISFLFVFIMSSLVFYFDLSTKLVNISILLLSLIGAFCVARLVETITHFHVATIAGGDSRGAYVSCMALKVLKVKNHKAALTTTLSFTKDSRLMKAIIHVMGCIDDKAITKILMDTYARIDKEEIQLSIVSSLVRFKSHHVDLFLLESLQEIIGKQTSLGEIRRSLFLKITERLKDVSIPMILKLLEDNTNDPRLVANAIIVLGEIGHRRNDSEVFDILCSYTDPKYSRRIRSNATLYLYKNEKYRYASLNVFEEFLSSPDLNDRSAAAFLAGELSMKGVSPFIWENSLLCGHKNPTLLFSLLKLNYPGVEEMIVEFILTADSIQSSLAINQLSSINNSSLRFRVYQAVLSKSRNQIDLFLGHMKNSNRDFDEDLRILEERVEMMA